MPILSSSEQGFSQTMQELQSYFISKGVGNPFTSEGYRAIRNSEPSRNAYIDYLTNDVSDENEKELLKDTIEHSMSLDEDWKSGSTVGYITSEGYSVGPNNGYSFMNHLNPMIVKGFLAKSYATEAYQILTNKNPEMIYKYSIDYVYKGTDAANKKSITSATRNGELGDMLKLPQLEPKFTGDAGTGLPGGENSNVYKGGFINLGSKGNLITSSGEVIAKSAIEDDGLY